MLTSILQQLCCIKNKISKSSYIRVSVHFFEKGHCFISPNTLLCVRATVELGLVLGLVEIRFQSNVFSSKCSRPKGVGEKRPKNSKKGRKIALLSLYLLYLYHI